MANYRAIASGNWNTAATWAGGAVPPNGAGHSIYSNTFTVTIDTNVDVALITNAANSGTFVGGGTAAAGGTFPLVNGVIITSNIGYEVSSVSLISTTGTVSATINGNISGSGGSSSVGVTHSSTGTLTVNGNVSGKTNPSFGGGHGIINNSSTGTVSVSGNITGGATTSDYGIYNASTGTIIIPNGNVIASVGTGIYNNIGGTITVGNGTVTGTTAFGINNAGAGLVSITGTLNAGTTAAGANNASTGTYTILGNITANNGANGFTSSSSSATNRLSGSFINSANGTAAVYAAKYILNSTPLNAKTRYALNGISTYVDMFTADNNLAQANPTDVRTGVSYASGALTGTLTVPAEGSVSLNVTVGPLMPFTATRSSTTATATLAYSYPYTAGDKIVVTGASNAEWNATYTIASVISGTSITFVVPVTYSSTAGTGAQMQTVGTAMLTAAAIFNTLTSTMTTSGSIGERLANASTVAVTGQQITNALG